MDQKTLELAISLVPFLNNESNATLNDATRADPSTCGSTNLAISESNLESPAKSLKNEFE
ncbi:hypothetical protein IG631_23324 [Alternaria alternata]|nr:hypothetical protein IG631_23324 [Alternaria alternata]